MTMSVWVIDPSLPAKGTVLLLHGIRSDKTWFVGLGLQVAAQGYRAVLPDLRGHGRSSGDFLTYGVHDVQDLKGLLDELGARGLLAGSVGAIGISYGGATAIQLAAVDPRVRAVVAIAPFSSLRAVVPNYVDTYLPLLGKAMPSSFIQSAIDEAGMVAHFHPDAASPLSSIVRTRAPVLLIHGIEDRHIPASHSRALHAAAPDHTRLLLLESENHDTISADRTRTIATEGIAWLRRGLEREPSR